MANYMLKYGEKARTVTTIIWVEDLERRWGENWQERFYGYMSVLGCPVAISPIHDKDVYTDVDVANWCRRHIDPDTGEVATEFTNAQPRVGDLKKAHIHIIIMTKGPQTREDFSQMLVDLVWVMPTKWQRVIHIDTMTRYLAHMDNADKFKYNWTDVISFGGFSLKPLTIAKSDEYAKASALASVMEYIEDNHVDRYHVLVKWAKALGDYDIWCCVTGRFGFFVAYFRSILDEKAAKEAKKKKREQQNNAEK